jgi:probable rRNA maturation factor
MTVDVDVAVESGRIPLSRARVAGIARAVFSAEHVRSAELSIAFVSDRTIAALNRKHLGHHGTTDVISFEFSRAPRSPVTGDIYIAPDVAREHARRMRVPVREELARLVVHGTLHVLGYSHPDGSEEERTGSPMWRRQERILARVLDDMVHVLP